MIPQKNTKNPEKKGRKRNWEIIWLSMFVKHWSKKYLTKRPPNGFVKLRRRYYFTCQYFIYVLW